jgi:protein-S-isoprenylcysteine O-methyltransferase Ste14
VTTTLYFGLCYALWRPLPWAPSPAARAVALALGAILFFPGVGLVLWGRLTLGEAYNASLSSGAQLLSGQPLITRGPFALVRHPMYLGINLVAIGGLLLYRTWTFAFGLTLVALIIRARLEEEVLAVEFGEQWEEYRRRVPSWIPRLRR